MSESKRKPHITVVGDLILDRYLIGDATKLNPEMPGVVIRVDKEDDRLGGAAAVAMLAAGFGAKMTLVGVVGDDEPGDRLRELLDAHGIESHVWVDLRPTTWKQRIVARGQLRPDRCDRGGGKAGGGSGSCSRRVKTLGQNPGSPTHALLWLGQII